MRYKLVKKKEIEALVHGNNLLRAGLEKAIIEIQNKSSSSSESNN
jgi:hypothetical protein